MILGLQRGWHKQAACAGADQQLTDRPAGASISKQSADGRVIGRETGLKLGEILTNNETTELTRDCITFFVTVVAVNTWMARHLMRLEMFRCHTPAPYPARSSLCGCTAVKRLSYWMLNGQAQRPPTF